ncbi:MAG TPA: sugar transferase [Gemmatimonadaceae bacterium]|nr:sugar transferase [Gemmatimonadaceae bacterium]
MQVNSSSRPAADAQSAPADGFDFKTAWQTSSRVLPIPPYDIRLRRELAQRRLIASLGRQILRIASLHLLDAVTTASAALIVASLLDAEGARQLAPALVALVLIGLNAKGAYRPGGARRDLKRLAFGVALAGGVLAVFTLLPPRLDLSIWFAATFTAVCIAALLCERRLVDATVRQAYSHGIGLRRAIIVGRRVDVADVVSHLRGDANRDHQIVGFVTPGRIHDASALGSIDELDAILSREDPSELILAGSQHADVVRRVADASIKFGTAMIAVPTWGRDVRGWAEPVQVGSLAGYHVHPAKLGMPAMALKRAADLALATVALVVCAPLMGLIAIAVKLDSRGPVFFRQRRVGLGGRQFMMWKFRSMRPEAEHRRDEIAHLNHYPDGRLFKLRDDPRVTTLGRLLRRFSLDELPQLLNVIAGDMSLVGPRPPVPSEVGKYEARHFIRLSVVPGMTGPWQVGGRNLITNFEDVVRLEREYIDDWSFRLDLRIMAKTVGVVLSGKGAY